MGQGGDQPLRRPRGSCVSLSRTITYFYVLQRGGSPTMVVKCSLLPRPR